MPGSIISCVVYALVVPRLFTAAAGSGRGALRSTGSLASARALSSPALPVVVYTIGPSVDNLAHQNQDCRVVGTLEEAKVDCSADPSCSALHDFGCDNANWRICSATVAQLSIGDGLACTMVPWRAFLPVCLGDAATFMGHRRALCDSYRRGLSNDNFDHCNDDVDDSQQLSAAQVCPQCERCTREPPERAPPPLRLPQCIGDPVTFLGHHENGDPVSFFVDENGDQVAVEESDDQGVPCDLYDSDDVEFCNGDVDPSQQNLSAAQVCAQCEQCTRVPPRTLPRCVGDAERFMGFQNEPCDAYRFGGDYFMFCNADQDHFQRLPAAWVCPQCEQCEIV